MLVFISLSYMPGGPAQIMAGEKHLTPQALANVRHRLGIDRPIYRQYLDYLKNLSQGNLGISYRYNRPVKKIVKDYFFNSIRLGIVAVILELLIGLPLGVIAAVKQGSFWDHFITSSTIIFICIPVFWLGLMFQSFFSLRLGWLPTSPPYNKLPLSSYILPSLTLALVYTAFVIRTVKTSLLEVLQKDYILAAKASGLPERVILFKYALKNALLPVITVLGLDLGALMGGAVATEVVFNWPGIGYQLYLAVLARDKPLVVGGALLLTFAYVAINFLVDLLYLWLDPRLRQPKPIY